MKTMTLGMTYFIAASLLAQSAVAGCLPHVPTTQYDLDRQIKMAKVREAVTSDSAQRFGDLARDAEKTHNQAVVVFGTSATIPLGIFALGSFIYGAVGVQIGLLGAVVGVGGFGYDVVETSSALIQLGYPKAQVPKISQELRQKAVAAQFSCSYEDIRSRLAAERASVFENEMSGSGWRTVQDHLTLGSLSKKGTAKLFMIASLEKEVAAAEVKELSQLQIARVVKSAPTATEGRR